MGPLRAACWGHWEQPAGATGSSLMGPLGAACWGGLGHGEGFWVCWEVFRARVTLGTTGEV